MPTYGYKCRECKTEFDVFRKISDDPVEKCPECGGPVKRVFHPVGIIFKGSGFYTTDYKKKQTDPAPANASGDSGAKKNEDGEKKKKNEDGEKKSGASESKPKETAGT